MIWLKYLFLQQHTQQTVFNDVHYNVHADCLTCSAHTFQSLISRGATLHQQVVVTGSGTYGEHVEREPITGVWGQSPE